METPELISILQSSTSPVILISGVGLLLLSMTNRLGRLVDRVRTLSAEAEKMPPDHHEIPSIRHQIEIIYSRARDTRLAVIFSVVSIFCVALLILSLFGINAMRLPLGWLAVTFFISSLASLVISLVFFLKEIHLSLEALQLEIAPRK